MSKFVTTVFVANEGAKSEIRCSNLGEYKIKQISLAGWGRVLNWGGGVKLQHSLCAWTEVLVSQSSLTFVISVGPSSYLFLAIKITQTIVVAH